jgi:hypothetical protein
VAIKDPSSAQYGVSDAFLDNLGKLALQETSWWHDVLMRDDVFIAARNNSLDVYYRGCSIFQIRDDGNGTVKPNTHVKYLVRQQEARVELNADNKFILPPGGFAWERYEGDKTLSDMLTAAQALAGLEKSGLHPLVVGSPNVIDVEISLRASHPLPDQRLSGKDSKDAKSYDRLDAAALEQRGNDTFVVFHEAKHFSNPDLAAKAGNTPKVVEQIRGYRSTIKHHEALLVERYRSVCRTLERIDAMRPRPRNSSGPESFLQKVLQTGVELRIDPNPRLIVFGFDAGQRDGRWQAYLENITQAEPDLNVYAAGNPETATGAFRPPRSKRIKKVTPELSSKI